MSHITLIGTDCEVFVIQLHLPHKSHAGMARAAAIYTGALPAVKPGPLAPSTQPFHVVDRSPLLTYTVSHLVILGKMNPYRKYIIMAD